MSTDAIELARQISFRMETEPNTTLAELRIEELSGIAGALVALHLESAALSSQIAALRTALAEACTIADDLGYGHGDIPAHRRINELRKLAEVTT